MKIILTILLFPIVYVGVIVFYIVNCIFSYIIKMLSALLRFRIFGLIFLIAVFPIMLLMDIIQSIYNSFIICLSLASEFVYGEKANSNENQSLYEFQTFTKPTPKTEDYETIHLETSEENERVV